MKKGLKKAVVLAMAGIMTIASVMTASAETVVSGGTYQITFPDRNIFGERLQAVTHQVIVSHAPLREDLNDQYHQNDIVAEAKAGYEMKGVYFYYPESLYVPDLWSANAEGSGTWTPTEYYSENGIEYGGLVKTYTFTVNMNGQDYPDCAFYLDFNGYEDYSRCYAAFRLPVGYTGNAYFKVHDYNEHGAEIGHTLDYYFSGNGETAVPATSSPSWKQDAKGWWIENPDGTYLTNQWYQSPTSSLWYYMGADGYMLTNTTTPDGYTVNADGVWVQ